MTGTAENLDAVLADLAAVIDPGDRSRPTPCTAMDVAALRTHVLGWLDTFAGGFADPDGQAPRAGLEGYRAPEDGGAAVAEARTRLGTALAAGAADRPLTLGEASMPGAMALSMVVWEYVVHGWDLAVATGRSWDPPPAAVAEALEFAPGMLTEDYQGEGKTFGPRVPVPDDAPALDRLLGLSGRDPSWRP